MNQINFFPDTLFYNENINLNIKIENFSKRIARKFTIKLRIDYENAYTIKLSKYLEDFELEYNSSFMVFLRIKQGEGGQNNSKKELEFTSIKGGNYELVYENRNLIERVYKITSTCECMFRNNKQYISHKEYVKSFKNYKLFNAQLYFIDLFGISNLKINTEWEYEDISDSLQFYFEIVIKFSNIANQNIFIHLRDKSDQKKSIKKIVLVDKNIIKFNDSKKVLEQYLDLNQKYELFWEIVENNRSGIIHFTHPLKFNQNLKIEFENLKNLKIGALNEFTVIGTSLIPEIKTTQKVCEVVVESKRNHNPLIEGKTIFRFEKNFKKNYKLILTEPDEYFLYIIIKLKSTQKANIYRKNLILN